MTCDQAIDLLPWLLNGTLEDQERAEVRGHLETCERCRQALAETRETGRMFDQHIPTAAMVALAWGEEPPGLDRETIESHLASCPQCAAELELTRTSRRLEDADNLAIFPTPRPAGEVPRVGRWRLAALAAGFTGLITASGWFYTAGQVSDLSQRLAQLPAAVPTAPAPGPSPSNAAEQRLAQMDAEKERLQKKLAVQAAQAEKVQTQIAQMETALRGLAEPQINSWVGDLKTSGEVVRGETTEQVIPYGQTAVPLLQADSKDRTHERTIEVRDAAGKRVWRKTGLLRTENDDYSVAFPPGFLKKGRYTIQLFSQNGTPRETYKIRVE
jgi:anti-sigma factor RsiW